MQDGKREQDEEDRSAAVKKRRAEKQRAARGAVDRQRNWDAEDDEGEDGDQDGRHRRLSSTPPSPCQTTVPPGGTPRPHTAMYCARWTFSPCSRPSLVTTGKISRPASK